MMKAESVKTGRVAVYLETLQYRLGNRFPPAYSTGDTTDA